MVPCLSFAKGETQKTIPQVWELEPNSILNIKIGIPLSEQMNECPKNKSGSYGTYTGETCWEFTKSLDYYHVETPPVPGFEIFAVTPYLVQGNVEAVSFSFRQYDYKKAADLLKSKYGNPTSEKNITKQNRMFHAKLQR